MPKIAQELSALAVSRLKSPGRHPVGGCPGLQLHITPAGTRRWVLRAVIDETRRDLSLGDYPAISVSDARTLARDYRQKIRSGIDPLAEQRQRREQRRTKPAVGRTFRSCAEALIEAKRAGWKNIKHAGQWSATLAAYVYPVCGDLPVEQVGLPHVLACLEPIWTEKPETASRLRGRIEAVLSYAAVRGLRNGDNPARWRGHLDAILPARSKVAVVRHHPAMPLDQAPGFFQKVMGATSTGAWSLTFLILTATRSGEVRGATWSEIDLERGIWTIPAARMKAGQEHRVPLSRQALDLLTGLPRLTDSGLLFPSAKGGKISDMTMTAILRRMRLPYVPHGFRSTFRDWAGELTSYPRDLAEQALAHTIRDKAEAAYRRGDALERRRTMMQEWADWLQGRSRCLL